MRILYDGNAYLSQLAGGVNRYFANLISCLPEHVVPTVASADHPRMYPPSHPNLRWEVWRAMGWPKAVEKWRRRRYFRNLYERIDADILHPTSYALLSGNNFDRIRQPIVLTVYDMIHEKFAPEIDPKGKTATIKKRAIERAQSIICISQNTKQDLLALCDVPEERVSVIHLAAELKSSMADPSTPTPDAPYFIYVGSRDQYKNFERLLVAMREVIRRQHCRLCLVGSPLNQKEQQRIAELGLADHIDHFGHASDPQLAQLYAASKALVYPSMYEGFGIPPLEAMQCGTAVVAAKSSSIPEVVDDAALLFDPTSTDQLADILIDLLDNRDQRATLVERGRRRAALFTWEQTARETMNVYRATMNNEPVSSIGHTVERIGRFPRLAG